MFANDRETLDAGSVLREFLSSGQGPTRPTKWLGTLAAASVAREYLRRRSVKIFRMWVKGYYKGFEP